MTYFDPVTPKTHTCPLPDAERFPMQSGWRCDCGKAYVREMVSQHGETWWQWKRALDFDQGKV